jgi:uncharacterized lipoprotein YajG
MTKQLLISLLPLFTIAFLLTGCEKTQSTPEKKNQLEKAISNESTPSSETPKMPAVEITGDKKERVTTGEALATENQKFEGSQSLKRYLDDSP